MTEPVLAIDGLDVIYHTDAGPLPALQDISFTVDRGEIVGIVGESGCGKSTLGSALLRLLPPNGELAGGRVLMAGRDLLGLPSEEMRRIRGSELAMIFQDPLTSLNPIFTIGTQMLDAALAHKDRDGARRASLRDQAAEVLTQVGIPDAGDRLGDFPHQFSGGMRQRIMIATALMLRPALLIADEPTSALDVTLEAQILELFQQLRRAHGTAILLISHDLGVIAQTCDRVVVMYAGRAVEEGDVHSVFSQPLHPYTQALLESSPSRERRGQRLMSIPGRVPSLSALPRGCAFAERCRFAQDSCRAQQPRYVTHAGRHVRCIMYDPSSGYGEPNADAHTG